MSPESKLPQFWGFLRRRNQAGLKRAKNSLPRILRMTLAAVGAYFVANELLGHSGPIFAATSALIALGFGGASTIRRTLEVSMGCVLGVALGDALTHWWGSGLWQAAAVMALSLLVARYLDSGPIFCTQLGMQSALVVLLPIGPDGPFSRSIDALVGAGLAVLVLMLLPTDPRRKPIAALGNLLTELSEILTEAHWAVRDNDHREAFHALIRARATQKQLDALPDHFTTAREVATFAPAQRRHRHELARMAKRIDKYDLAARSLRVFTRRLSAVLSDSSLTEAGSEAIAVLLREMSEAVNALAHAVREPSVDGERRYERMARRQLEECAGRLDPRSLGVSGLQGEGLVLLLRPLIVDLLEAAGRSHEEALSPLPKLG